jgi:ribosomal protein S20
MRKIILSAAILSAVAVAAPASAQRWDNGGARHVQQELNQIEQRIHHAAQRGLLSRNEARRLFTRAERIERLAYSYQRGGLDHREHRDLQNRLQDLRQELRFERQEGRDDRRYSRR